MSGARTRATLAALLLLSACWLEAQDSRPGRLSQSTASRPGRLCQSTASLPGRLFHTPAERAALDHEARAPTARPALPQRQKTVRAADPARSPQLSGFVLRSDGRDSYWVGAAPGPAR